MPVTVLPPALRYNATIDERRYTPRAHLDESSERHTQKGLVLLGGREHCDRLQFHVLVSEKEDKDGVSSSVSPWRGPNCPSKDALQLTQNSNAPQRLQGAGNENYPPAQVSSCWD